MGFYDFSIAIALKTGGSRKLFNNEIYTNKLEHHKHSCIPIEALVPSMNKTPHDKKHLHNTSRMIDVSISVDSYGNSCKITTLLLD